MIRSGNHYEYTGCIHIHTTDSDGTKPADEIAAIASSVRLDYIMISDHMTLKARNEGKEGFFDETLVIVGYEHNDQEDCNHYLLFDSEDVLPSHMTPQEYVREGRRQGALGIIAHPDEIRPRFGKYRSFPWLAWDAEGYDGIEIWNQMSEWMERLTSNNQIKMLFSPRRSMHAPTARILEKWDSLNMKRKVAGLAAIDAHAFRYRIGPFRVRIFPYKVQFQSLRTHLLLPEKFARDLNAAKTQVFEAIRDCRLFVSNHRWGDASGFQFLAKKGSHLVISGGSLDSFQNSTIIVRAPSRGVINLICNGEKLAEVNGMFLEYKPLQNGLYRAEVYKKDRGWIFSNHIRIGL
jgi:hypothetical protein